MIVEHHENIRQQFAPRIATYETAARWMLSPELIAAQREMMGPAPKDQNRCLDLCCGTGIVGRNLLDLGWQVQGLDLTPEMVAVASRYFPAEVGSVESIPMADSSFDAATLRQSFMLVDGKKTMAEVARVLKPGGRFLLIQSVSFSEADDSVYEQVQRARHINLLTYYRAQDLVDLMSEFGFTDLTARTLVIRESVDHWLKSAPELGEDLRKKIRSLIADAPPEYKAQRNVQTVNGELFEDWNWLLLIGKKAN